MCALCWQAVGRLQRHRGPDDARTSEILSFIICEASPFFDSMMPLILSFISFVFSVTSAASSRTLAISSVSLSEAYRRRYK